MLHPEVDSWRGRPLNKTASHLLILQRSLSASSGVCNTAERDESREDKHVDITAQTEGSGINKTQPMTEQISNDTNNYTRKMISSLSNAE